MANKNEPVIFVVKSMKHVGHKLSTYENRGDGYRTHYYGPEFVKIDLSVESDDPNESPVEMKLVVTEKQSRAFRMGGRVELWPKGGPKQERTKNEVRELKKMMALPS